MRHLLQGRRGGLADHLARVMVYGQEDSRYWGTCRCFSWLHSATEPRGVRLFRWDLNRTALPLLAEQIGGEDAAVRPAMVMAQLTGFAIMLPRAPPRGLRGRPWRSAARDAPVQQPRRLYWLRHMSTPPYPPHAGEYGHGGLDVISTLRHEYRCSRA